MGGGGAGSEAGRPREGGGQEGVDLSMEGGVDVKTGLGLQEIYDESGDRGQELAINY